MSLASQYQASQPVPSATYAGWDAITQQQPLWSSAGGGGGGGAGRVIPIASSATPGAAVASSTIFTSAAVTANGTVIFSASQMLTAAQAGIGNCIVTVSKNGTAIPNALFASSFTAVTFSILVPVVVGDVLTVSILTSGTGTFGLGAASITYP